MTTGSLGGSKVRSPNPSAINTITFCNSPFWLITRSSLRAGVECCFPQLGSAAILRGVRLGASPSNLTVPLRVAVPVGLLAAAGGLPALVACGRGMKINIVTRIAAGMRLLIVISHLSAPFAQDWLFSVQVFRNSVSSADKSRVRKVKEGVVILPSASRHFHVIFLST